MRRILCPACSAAFTVDEDELSLFNRFQCDTCHAWLEVIEEDPLKLELIDEEYDELEGDDDDDED